MQQTRQQLTLFITLQTEVIEQVRSQFNPIQHSLIPAHVTLCREDEIEQLDQVLANIKDIKLSSPIQMTFGVVEQFENGKGVYMPAKAGNDSFQQLRKLILKGINDSPRALLPHITLVHPRNSTCTSEIFEQIKSYPLPTVLSFYKISLITQINGGKWKITREFDFVVSKKE